MSKIAIFSDIHGNKDALSAIIEDITIDNTTVIIVLIIILHLRHIIAVPLSTTLDTLPV